MGPDGGGAVKGCFRGKWARRGELDIRMEETEGEDASEFLACVTG